MPPRAPNLSHGSLSIIPDYITGRSNAGRRQECNSSLFRAPRIGRRQVIFVDQAMRRAAAVAPGMEIAGGPRANVPHERPEERERRVVPDLLERIREDIAQPELLNPEEQVAGIDRAIGHHAEFCGACRAANMREIGIILRIGKKTRAIDGADLGGPKVLNREGAKAAQVYRS